MNDFHRKTIFFFVHCITASDNRLDFSPSQQMFIVKPLTHSLFYENPTHVELY